MMRAITASLEECPSNDFVPFAAYRPSRSGYGQAGSNDTAGSPDPMVDAGFGTHATAWHIVDLSAAASIFATGPVFPRTTMTAPIRIRIDFVSDVACPWCAIGLASLQRALTKLDGEIQADIHLQPFELNPSLPPEGEDASEHIMRKYGIGEAQLETNRKAIRDRAATLGFAINTGPGGRVWNTFDAHRLLHWAGLQDSGKAVALKQALFHAYFSDNENVADRDVLLRIASEAGLDAQSARGVLERNDYAEEVRAQERHFQQAGIHSVPATIVNNTYLISGGQPPETFEHALREIAAKRSSN
jgi:predicted DsbA family dithiol-disulfide isomerase